MPVSFKLDIMWGIYFRMKINYGGLVSIPIIATNLYLFFILNLSRASLIYEFAALVIYAIAAFLVTTVEELKKELKKDGHYFRFLFGCHLAFILLTCGLLLDIHRGFFAPLGLFVSAVLVGFVIPYLIIQEESK